MSRPWFRIISLQTSFRSILPALSSLFFPLDIFSLQCRILSNSSSHFSCLVSPNRSFFCFQDFVSIRLRFLSSYICTIFRQSPLFLRSRYSLHDVSTWFCTNRLSFSPIHAILSFFPAPSFQFFNLSILSVQTCPVTNCLSPFFRASRGPSATIRLVFKPLHHLKRRCTLPGFPAFCLLPLYFLVNPTSLSVSLCNEWIPSIITLAHLPTLSPSLLGRLYHFMTFSSSPWVLHSAKPKISTKLTTTRLFVTPPNFLRTPKKYYYYYWRKLWVT